MNFSAHWKRNSLIAVLVVLTGLFLFYNRDNPPVSVRLAQVERAGNLISDLNTNGKVEPLEPKELRTLMPGFVQAIPVKEGQQVKRGQVLVQLDRGEASAEVARAEAALQAALAELDNVQRGGSAGENNELENQILKARADRDEAARQLGISERLLKASAVPKDEVEQGREKLRQAERDLSYLEQRRARRYGQRDREQAQARVADARAALEVARTHLAAATATSPVDGTLYSLPVRAGNFLNRGDLIANVADLSKLRVKVYVDEPELGRLALQQEVVVTWDAQPGASWKGRVERLPAAVVQLGTRNVGEVHCLIENNDHKLLPNTNVNVEIITRRAGEALTVAKEAVQYDNPQSGPATRYVFLYEDGKVHHRDITVGISTATRVEIVNGLSAGQTVAVPADGKLADGARVKVMGGPQ